MEKLKILYLCTGNSCRSQMAEAWTRALKSDFITAYSAGIETHGLNPHAVKVMQEVGIDMSVQKSQHIDEFKSTPLDIVITVCGHAHETCPYFPSESRVIHIPFEDPPKLAKAMAEKGLDEQAQLDAYREVRDQIKQFVESLSEIINQKTQ